MDNRKEKVAVSLSTDECSLKTFFKELRNPHGYSFYGGDDNWFYFFIDGVMVYLPLKDVPKDYKVFKTTDEANDYLKQLDMEEKAKAEEIEEIIKYYYGVHKSNPDEFRSYYGNYNLYMFKKIQAHIESYCTDAGYDFLIEEFKRLETETKEIPRKVLLSDNGKDWYEYNLIYDAGESVQYRYYGLNDGYTTAYGYCYMKEIPEAKKMTIPQIEEKLGYKIEIVK